MSILQTSLKADQPPETKIQPLPLATVPQQPERTTFNVFDHLITQATKVPEIEPVVKVGGSVFAVKGDLSFISGPPKAGKSSVCSAILASCFLEFNKKLDETLQIESVYAGKREVIYIDTEQPKPYTKGMIDKVIQICGLQKAPTNLRIINLRELTKPERRAFLECCFEQFSNEHLYFLDGLADFVNSVNDENECADYIGYLMRKSSQKQVPIICVVHENPVGGKLRGHLGSEAERKCGGSIAIRKDREKQIHWIEAKMLRGTSDFEPVYFQWNPELKRFTTASDNVTLAMKEDKKKSSEQKKMEKLETEIQEAYGTDRTLVKAALITRLIQVIKLSDKTARRRITEAETAGVIKHNTEDNSYSLI